MTRVQVPRLLALVRAASQKGIFCTLTPRPESLTLELAIEGRLYYIGTNSIRHYYVRFLPIPAGAEVKDGWVAQTLSLDELVRQRSVETAEVSRMWGADIMAARRGEGPPLRTRPAQLQTPVPDP
uniref:Uncharacterized protein n=1 Tax=uncultured organism Bio4 TaxID=460931 RepID=B2BKA7_9ZZZZ|nr:unknown [uncultured organism Bio4]